MKTFLITISIIGAIVYGMLQINEHYDDKGACSWGLFSGGYYYHEERLDNAVDGLMKDIIKHDKKARKALMVKQGKSEEEIDKTLKSLEPQYKIEKEKMQKYCYLDFEKEPYFQKKSMRAKPSAYCEIGNGNNYDDNGYIGVSTKYKFDDASLIFFKLTNLVGIEYHTAYSPCDTIYQGLGESGNFVVK